MTATFVFCEAYPAYGRWHIRQVGPEGLKPSGACPPPLCCTEGKAGWYNGWDLPNVPLDPYESGLRVGEIEARERRLMQACPRCVALYRKLKETA